MPALQTAATLIARQYYGSSYTYYRRSRWSTFGRWILTGVLIFVAFLVLSAILFRLRRRRAKQTQYGGATGAAGPTGGMSNMTSTGYHEAGNHNAQQETTYAPPPGKPPGFGENEYGNGAGGYNNGGGYGYGQQSGVTQPGNTYQRGK